MLLVIDNYDSFTYNLVQMLECLRQEPRVFRNDEIDLAAMEALAPEALVISPGPCGPEEAGISVAAIRHFGGRIPVLGVCLGHQAIAAAYGGRVVRAWRPMHGKTSMIYHDGRTIFRDLPNPFEAVRYHSLIVERQSLPACLEVTAWTAEGEIMGLRHKAYQVEGVQFHPESILTVEGARLMAAFAKGGYSDDQGGHPSSSTGRGPAATGNGGGHGRNHGREGHAGADRSFHHRSQNEGRNGGGDHRRRIGDAA